MTRTRSILRARVAKAAEMGADLNLRAQARTIPCVKMGFGVLWSRPEVQRCGGEGSYRVTWECGVGWRFGVRWRSGVGVEVRSAEMRSHGIRRRV